MTAVTSLLTTALALAGMTTAAIAAPVSNQITRTDICGADAVGAPNGYNCTANEVDLANVTQVVFENQGDLEQQGCVLGEPLTVLTATAEFAINTNARYDIIAWVGASDGADPRLPFAPGTNECVAMSLPGPFDLNDNGTDGNVDDTNNGEQNNPFGDDEPGDAGDVCGDIFEDFTGNVTRTYTNFQIECQDNDDDGFLDTNILITWSQQISDGSANKPSCNANSFTVGTAAKCDLSVGLGGQIIPIARDPRITLLKTVNNDDGGTAVDTDFTLTATGPDVISGVEGNAAITNAEVAPGDYTLSEVGPAGYTASAWSCVDGNANPVAVNAGVVTLERAPEPGLEYFCTITNDDQPATLTLTKNTLNQFGGTAVDTDFTLVATGPDVISGVEGDAAITGAMVSAGVYTLTETNVPAGYALTDLTCLTDGVPLNGNQLTLDNGESAICIFQNDDTPATLTLTKTVVNNNGGNAVDTDFTLSFTGPDSGSGVEGDAAITNAQVSQGVYTLAEVPLDGYTPGMWQCAGDGILSGDQLSLGLGESSTCTIVNDDDAPGLTLVKDVTNDDGGTAVAGSFTLILTGADGVHNGGLPYSDGAMPPVDANVTYTLSEQPFPGYTQTGVACVDDDTAQSVAHPVTLNEGQSVTCTLSNDDDPPQLTVVKEVINDDGGTAVPADFTLVVTGADGTNDAGVNYASGDMVAGVQGGVVYTLSEQPLQGYNQTGVACEDDNTAQVVPHPATLSAGQQVTCTLTNDDQPVGLTLLKNVINDNGGTAVATDFTLNFTGPVNGSGVQGDAAITGVAVPSGDYTLTETNIPAGYTEGTWSCNGGTLNGNVVTIDAQNDTSVSCTISNDDDPAELTLTKLVINDDGGTAVDTDWTLTATGPTTITGAEGDASITNATVNAGVYTLTESGGPAGYVMGTWSCTGGILAGNQLTLAVGESASCEISNDDVGATLTLQKIVVNDDGGIATTADFTLSAMGAVNISGVSGDPAVTNAAVSAGVYTLSETTVDGYTAGMWQCTGGSLAGDQLTLVLGDAATCVIVNDDIAPALTLVKEVINDDGGAAVPGSFTLLLTGADGVHDAGLPYSSGASPVVQANVTYTLSEDMFPGYTQTGIACVDDSDQSPVAHPVTLESGQSVTCTLTNDDNAPGLTVTKFVQGGTALPSDFELTVTGADGVHDAGLPYQSGDMVTPVLANVTYTLSEAPGQVPDYVEDGVSCRDNDTNAVVPHPVQLQAGQSVTCTIFNRLITERPAITVPVNSPWALLMLLLSILGVAWYYRPSY